MAHRFFLPRSGARVAREWRTLFYSQAKNMPKNADLAQLQAIRKKTHFFLKNACSFQFLFLPLPPKVDFVVRNTGMLYTEMPPIFSKLGLAQTGIATSYKKDTRLERMSFSFRVILPSLPATLATASAPPPQTPSAVCPSPLWHSR